jgi:hypothetical protein
MASYDNACVLSETPSFRAWRRGKSAEYIPASYKGSKVFNDKEDLTQIEVENETYVRFQHDFRQAGWEQALPEKLHNLDKDPFKAGLFLTLVSRQAATIKFFAENLWFMVVSAVLAPPHMRHRWSHLAAIPHFPLPDLGSAAEASVVDALEPPTRTAAHHVSLLRLYATVYDELTTIKGLPPAIAFGGVINYIKRVDNEYIDTCYDDLPGWKEHLDYLWELDHNPLQDDDDDEWETWDTSSSDSGLSLLVDRTLPLHLAL